MFAQIHCCDIVITQPFRAIPCNPLSVLLTYPGMSFLDDRLTRSRAIKSGGLAAVLVAIVCWRPHLTGTQQYVWKAQLYTVHWEGPFAKVPGHRQV